MDSGSRPYSPWQTYTVYDCSSHLQLHNLISKVLSETLDTTFLKEITAYAKNREQLNYMLTSQVIKHRRLYFIQDVVVEPRGKMLPEIIEQRLAEQLLHLMKMILEHTQHLTRRVGQCQ